MKEKLQTKFATRQYMISDTFELYYYSTDDVPGVKEHTHTHYEFYLFLEGAISLEIDGVLYTPTPGDLLLIPPGVPHHLVMHDLSVPYRRFVFWVSAAFAEQLRARSADYVYLMEYAAENQKYLFPLDSVEFNTIQYRTIRLIEEMRSDHFGTTIRVFTARLKKSTGSRRRILKNCIPLPAINTVVPNALFTLYFSGGFLICFRCGEN